ncbi:HAMP domain-containing sensor histidine kinase [Actinoplanes sp. NPDC049668]|uniref:HAMP domain-containing sensor histidine kinase n=1 Tax=unclassified Actinoplanes TaxID=2626549 RepID=UPI0033AE8743
MTDRPGAGWWESRNDEEAGTVSLFWRVFAINAAVLTAATVLVLLGPVTVSTPFVLTEALILSAGLVAMLVANGLLLRIGLAPLQRLTRAMTTIDLLRPGPRPTVTGHGGVADLISAFNAMLDRLEADRASSNARALSAQENERRRIAQELHDEIGQTLTAVLLQMKRVADLAPPELRGELYQVQESVRDSLDEIRRIARRLRPGVLEELGLIAALRSLFAEVVEHSGLQIRRDFAPDLPALSEEAELVLYRVTQEGLTNVARHAAAHRVDITLAPRHDGVRLQIRDDGRGIDGGSEGAGIRGMRERALLVGARLSIGPRGDGGTEVTLDIPAGARQALT